MDGRFFYDFMGLFIALFCVFGPWLLSIIATMI